MNPPNALAPDPTAFDPFEGSEIILIAPSTEPQREIWTATRLGDDASLAFNESVSVWFDGRFDAVALRDALADLSVRHEALNTTFSADGMSLIVSTAKPLLPVFRDLSTEDEAARGTEIRRLLTEEVETPFDLEKGPLFRANLVRVGETRHLLTLTAHHIVCDGWSTAILVKDLSALYSARVRGAPHELGPAEPFSAYAAAEIDAAALPERAADRDYWRRQFAGEIPVLELPTDGPRPPRKTFEADRIDISVDAALVSAARKMGAKHRASLFTTLLGVFKVLLHRLSGQTDLVVGIPAAGQSQGGHDALVGHCVHTLPIRSACDPAVSFATFLTGLHGTMLDASDHQAFTYGSLLKELPVARDPSRLPLVSVVFNVDRGLGPDALPFDPALVATLSTNPRHFENFELFVNAVELAGVVTFEVQFNTDLFERATVARWFSIYEQLLRAVVAEPGAVIGALPVLSPADREWLARVSEAFGPLPEDPRVHRMIEARVDEFPDLVAVEAEGVSLTYRELEARANRVARRLRRAGVRQGTLVGLSMERSAGMIVGLLGVMKAGGAYVPLDPGYPRERLAYMVADSALPVLLTERRLRDELALPAPQVLCIDDDAEGSPEEEARLAPSDDDAGPESPCYVIYTSGSTGKPKGVLVPHLAVANLLASVAETPGMARGEVMLAITTLSFDIAALELYLPLVVGARVVVVSREIAMDGRLLVDAIHRHGVTIMQATPSTWRLLLDVGFSHPGLTALVGGEPFPTDLAAALLGRASAVWNMYGPTETTIWSTCHRVERADGPIPIGRPVRRTTVSIRDSRLELVPIGSSGELYIGGDGVTLGYHARPELTRERFLPDPSRPGARMYKTGDLARFLPDGSLECLGRNDNQIKLRGFRIELGEIEDALSRHSAIRQAAVIVREDRPGDRRLVGYLVHSSGRTATDSELRTHLKSTLPEYMVPSAFVRLDLMPLTPSGKIDRKALPEPGEKAGTAENFVEPRTPTEQMVAELWKQALGIGRVSVNDDFFALGGHSLLASQVLARLRRDQGAVISFRAMFEAPTIAAFAELIDGSESGVRDRAPTEQQIPRRAEATPARLSLMQERLWLLEEMDPSHRVVHHLPAAWRLTGPLDAGVLQAALGTVARRHETLRTTIAVKDGKPVQVVHDSASVALPLVDFRALPAEEREPKMAALFEEESRKPFDLTTGPLFRALLVRLADDEHVLFTVRHNIIWDGWSFDVFLHELSSAYGAPDDAALPTLPISYSDFSVWHRTWLEGTEIASQTEFWRKQLEGELRSLDMPTDRPRATRMTHAGGNESVVLPRRLVDALTQVARDSGTTLFMVLLAAFDTLLHRYTGETDLLVGTPVRARTRPETEPLIGVFVNNVVLRVPLEPSQAFRELLSTVRRVTLDAFSHQEAPPELLGIKPPVLRALFSLQDARQRPRDIGPARVTQVHVPAPAASNDLLLWMMESEGGLLAALNYNADVFDPATTRRFLSHYETLLESVVRDPDQKLGSLVIIPPAEAGKIDAFTRGRGASAPVHELLEARIARAPSTLAIRGERDVTYGELGERAERIAEHLRRSGVGAGSTVGVGVVDAENLVSALLGVFKVGGSALVFDPTDAGHAVLAAARGSAPLVVVTTSEHEEVLPEGVVFLRLETATTEAGQSREPTAGQASNEALLSPVFGADGTRSLRPVSHATLSGAAAAIASELGLTETDAAVVAMPAGTTLSVAALFSPLLVGATLIAGPSSHDDVHALRSTLDGAKATVLVAPSSTWEALWSVGRRSSLQRGVSYGHPLAGRTVEAMLGSGLRIWTAYGTEDTVGFATLGELRPGVPANVLGAPLPGVHARVSAPDGDASPIGVYGELSLGEGPEELRSTGDRARWRPDGTLEWRARADERSWVRGCLVDPRPVARVLSAHPAVLRAEVVLREHAGSSRLVAYFVPKPGASYTETELRRAVREGVGRAATPNLYVELEEMPIVRGGAVDRSKLPAPFDEQSEDHYVPPRTEAERLLVELYREALGLSEVSVLDNFFDIGGYSLVCFSVIAKIEQRTGKRLSPRLLLLNTLEQVAAQIEAPKRVAAPVARPEPPRGGLLSRIKRIVRGG